MFDVVVFVMVCNITCSWRFYDFTWLPVICVWHWCFLWLVHDISMTFVWPLYDFLWSLYDFIWLPVICGWRWCLYGLYTIFSWHLYDVFMTLYYMASSNLCLTLMFFCDSYMTFPWLLYDSYMTFYEVCMTLYDIW